MDWVFLHFFDAFPSSLSAQHHALGESNYETFFSCGEHLEADTWDKDVLFLICFPLLATHGATQQSLQSTVALQHALPSSTGDLAVRQTVRSFYTWRG